MRPDILNPLFAEVEALKGVGPGLSKPLKRLEHEPVVHVQFHLPLSWIERKFEPEKRRLELIVHAEAPREREFTVDDAARLA